MGSIPISLDPMVEWVFLAQTFKRTLAKRMLYLGLIPRQVIHLFLTSTSTSITAFPDLEMERYPKKIKECPRIPRKRTSPSLLATNHKQRISYHARYQSSAKDPGNIRVSFERGSMHEAPAPVVLAVLYLHQDWVTTNNHNASTNLRMRTTGRKSRLASLIYFVPSLPSPHRRRSLCLYALDYILHSLLRDICSDADTTPLSSLASSPRACTSHPSACLLTTPSTRIST